MNENVRANAELLTVLDMAKRLIAHEKDCYILANRISAVLFDSEIRALDFNNEGSNDSLMAAYQDVLSDASIFAKLRYCNDVCSSTVQTLERISEELGITKPVPVLNERR